MMIELNCDTEDCPFAFSANVTDDEVRRMNHEHEGVDCPACGKSVAPCDERFRDAALEEEAFERSLIEDGRIHEWLETTIKRRLGRYQKGGR